MGRSEKNIVALQKIVNGGQAIGVLESGKKAFVWGALPGELVEFRVTKKRSKMVEGVVEQVITPSKDRIEPHDTASYLSTSPWQTMSFTLEQSTKRQLVDDAFIMHGVTLPSKTEVYTDNQQYGYRNKVEFSWWGDEDEQGNETLDLAFFRRGSKGKIPVNGTSLAREEITTLARAIRGLLHAKGVSARNLKTLLIRCDRQGSCVWQLYTKDKLSDVITNTEAEKLPAQGGEVIYSDSRSPASRITERLASFGNIVLSDKILGMPFHYVTESFFQVNLPVYEQALKDMEHFITDSSTHGTVDMYSGVGTIGLTIGGENCTLVEADENAVREMKRNITATKSSSRAIFAKSEEALNYITNDNIIIVDPPRAGLHIDVVNRLLEAAPTRILYLSCNPVTQARDVALLLEEYKIIHHKGYNFFPRTPHIEHFVVLDKA